jgi:hypothetical protein
MEGLFIAFSAADVCSCLKILRRNARGQIHMINVPSLHKTFLGGR